MTLSPPNLIKLLAPLVVFAAVLAVLLVVNGGGAPSLPALRRRRAPRPATRSRDFQRAVRAAPDGADAYAGLGDAYLQRARETATPATTRARSARFDAALRRDPRDLGALLGAGTLAGLRHDFREQLRLGRDAQRLEAPELAAPSR